jgi:DNA-binding NarL/FixJ family response regulator
MTPSTVVVADDHPIVVRGLRALLPASSFRVVGHATSAGECIEEVDRLRPDVLLLDLRLPDGLGPDVCRTLRERRIEVRVVVLTAFADDALLEACLAEGAAGVLVKARTRGRCLRCSTGPGAARPSSTRACRPRPGRLAWRARRPASRRASTTCCGSSRAG